MKGDYRTGEAGTIGPMVWTESRGEQARGCPARPGKHTLWRLLACSGDMVQVDQYVQDRPLALQLAVWVLRGVARVILANNPLSGALVLAALLWASPWQGLLGTVGVLASMLTAVIIGQDGAELSGGLHGFNGMLVSMLMGVFSSAGAWYWWLLLPACLGAAACTFLFSGLSPVLDRWDVPVAVFPFNIVISLYLLCTGPDNPYYPHYPATPAWALEPNATELNAAQLLEGVFLGVGQIYACGTLGPSLLILGALLLYSPLQALHAILGSAAGTLAGLSVAVRQDSLYSGLSGFNGALGCMSVGGLFFTFSWRTHLFAIATAFLSAYVDIAFSNLLGTIGLPACSWAATLVVSLMLLLTGRGLAAYRIPIGQVGSPEHNLRARSQWKASKTSEPDSTVV